METKTKKIMFGLIALIMLLSIIPLAFLGSGNQIDVPDIEDEDLVLTGAGEFRGKITSAPTMLSFVGLSESSDDSEVRDIINSIGYLDCTENSPDCSVKVGLNPYGKGYRYEVILKAKNTSDMNYLGFRLSYRLNSILDTSSPSLSPYALVPTSVLLQETSEIDGVQVTAKNISSVAYVSYSNSINETVKMKCEGVTYSKQGVLISAPACIDSTNYANADFGLDAYTVLDNAQIQNKTLELDLNFSKVYFRAFGEFNDTGIETKLNFADVKLYPDGDLIEVETTDISKTTEIQQVLDKYDIVTSYKLALVDFPESVVLDKEYEIIGDLIEIKFPTTQGSGTRNVKLGFMILFDEVVKIAVA